jgi:hypothetical protein
MNYEDSAKVSLVPKLISNSDQKMKVRD